MGDRFRAGGYPPSQPQPQAAPPAINAAPPSTVVIYGPVTISHTHVTFGTAESARVGAYPVEAQPQPFSLSQSTTVSFGAGRKRERDAADPSADDQDGAQPQKRIRLEQDEQDVENQTTEEIDWTSYLNLNDDAVNAMVAVHEVIASTPPSTPAAATTPPRTGALSLILNDADDASQTAPARHQDIFHPTGAQTDPSSPPQHLWDSFFPTHDANQPLVAHSFQTLDPRRLVIEAPPESQTRSIEGAPSERSEPSGIGGHPRSGRGREGALRGRKRIPASAPSQTQYLGCYPDAKKALEIENGISNLFRGYQSYKALNQSVLVFDPDARATTLSGFSQRLAEDSFESAKFFVGLELSNPSRSVYFAPNLVTDVVNGHVYKKPGVFMFVDYVAILDTIRQRMQSNNPSPQLGSSSTNLASLLYSVYSQDATATSHTTTTSPTTMTTTSSSTTTINRTRRAPIEQERKPASRDGKD